MVQVSKVGYRRMDQNSATLIGVKRSGSERAVADSLKNLVYHIAVSYHEVWVYIRMRSINIMRYSPANLACAILTASLSCLITVSGSSAPKMAVPATITLLPDEEQVKLRTVFQECMHTSIGANANRFGTYTTINFYVFVGEPGP